MSDHFFKPSGTRSAEQGKVRLARAEDLPAVMNLYAQARDSMAAAGNPTQWSGGYPPEALLKEDIQQRRLYVLERESGLYGVFAFLLGEDPTYQQIDGSWRDLSAYGTIHRLAGRAGVSGVFTDCLAFCREKCRHLRADTHRDNHIMQHLLTKHGFVFCGIIYVADGSPRLAYESSGDGVHNGD